MTGVPRVRVPLARHALTGALLASVAYLAGGAAAETYHTRHLNSDGTPRYLNALLNEASPYLRQHAYQPIQWQPWAESTLARARRENAGYRFISGIDYNTLQNEDFSGFSATLTLEFGSF